MSDVVVPSPVTVTASSDSAARSRAAAPRRGFAQGIVVGVGASLLATILIGGVRLPLPPLEPPVPPCVEEHAKGAYCTWATTDADGRSCCREMYVLDSGNQDGEESAPSHAAAGTRAADLASNAESLQGLDGSEPAQDPGGMR
jgi:hypothetical protein